eukprot:COSAG01_NODE_1081_length_11817_cov_3.279911_5_plen_99_part_00
MIEFQSIYNIEYHTPPKFPTIRFDHGYNLRSHSIGGGGTGEGAGAEAPPPDGAESFVDFALVVGMRAEICARTRSRYVTGDRPARPGWTGPEMQALAP